MSKKDKSKSKNRDIYINRELSWLKFNSRVLEEAQRTEIPLLERLNFSAIYENNLSEFFQVRIGKLTDLGLDKPKKKDRMGMSAAEQITAVCNAVRNTQPIVESAYFSTVQELKIHGYECVKPSEATAEELKFLELYFRREVKPLLSGLIVSEGHGFPFLKNKSLYICVWLHSKKGTALGVVPTEHIQRIIPLSEDARRFVLLEELVLHFCHLLFKGFRVLDRTVIRVTRSADILPSEKGSDFRERMEKLVETRKKLAPVRLETLGVFSRDALEYLCKKLKLKSESVFVSQIPLDLSFIYTLPEPDTSEGLRYEKRVPQKASMLSDSRSVFSQVRTKDVLLSYPFESMTSSFIRLLSECADDPKVVSIKITLYRLARSSKVIDALCTASENGKDVLVMIELRARFDEENNIEWSRQLQKAGVKVIYGPPGFKAHSKLLLITRKTTEGFEYLTQVGTGNYNEKTSCIYTDLALLTSDRVIARDAESVFNALINRSFVQSPQKLLVAPLALRPKILELIQEQIEISQNGGNGYIGAKVNALCDGVIMDKLVEASQAGVKIELVIRGICCLIPGVEGFTENIAVRSIVGRFLEHSRIFIFGCDESPKEQKIYIGSADYMSRNTVRRVEVACPVEDERVKKRIREIFSALLKDNVKARIMTSSGDYIPAPKSPDTPDFDAQEFLYSESYRIAGEKALRQKRSSKK